MDSLRRAQAIAADPPANSNKAAVRAIKSGVLGGKVRFQPDLAGEGPP
jgi:hypothetical protein